MKVLIVGAGIAGPTLAYWLRRIGYEPTLVERAPKLGAAATSSISGALASMWPIRWESSRS